jgi:thiol-disulfide isomerase/thioredoxin
MKSISSKFSILLLGIFAIIATYFALSNQDSPSDTVAVENQSSLYNIRLNDMDKNPVQMDENKIIFMNVWATWCGPCNMEMPSIQNLYTKYKDHPKVDFLIVSDEEPSTVNPFIERKGYNLPFYQYTSPFPEALDGNSIPRTYILYKGEILVQETGATQWDTPEVMNLIDEKLKEI